MGPHIEDAGKEIINGVMEFRLGQMVHNMRENGKGISNVVMECIHIQVEIAIKENGKMANHMGKES